MISLEKCNITQLRQIAKIRGIVFKEPRSGEKRPFLINLIEHDRSFYGELQEINPDDTLSVGDWIIVRKGSHLPLPVQIIQPYSNNRSFETSNLAGVKQSMFRHGPRMFRLVNYEFERVDQVVYKNKTIKAGDKLFSPFNTVQEVKEVCVTKGGEGWVVMGNSGALTLSEFLEASNREFPDTASYAGQYTKYKGQDEAFKVLKESITVKTTEVIKGEPEPLEVTIALDATPKRRNIIVRVKSAKGQTTSGDVCSDYDRELDGFRNWGKVAFSLNLHRHESTVLLVVFYLINKRIDSLSPCTSHRDIWENLKQVAKTLNQ